MVDPLTVLSAIDTSLSLAKELWAFAQDIKGFKTDHADLVIKFEYREAVLEKFIAFFSERQSDIDEKVRHTLIGVTKALNKKLEDLKKDVEARKKGNVWDHIVWHFIKDSLNTADRDLAEWTKEMHDIFSNLPQEMRDHLAHKFVSQTYWGHKKILRATLASDSMRAKVQQPDTKERVQELLNLRDKTGKLETQPDGKYFSEPDIIIVPDEYLHVSENREIEIEVAKLVDVLSDALAQEMHLPKAYRYFASKKGGPGTGEIEAVWRYGIVYEKPSYVKKTCKLKDMIKQSVGQRGSISLTQRMRIAYELTTAVAYFHSVGWVHELICPHNVTLSYDRGDLAPESGGLGQVTLFGFGNSRRDSRHVISHGPGASDWTVQLYCHPARQLERLQEELANRAASTKPGDVIKRDKKTRFEFKHDVYALGVVLLEIGLWQDLETLKGTGPNKTPLLMDAKPDKRKEILLGAADDLVGNAGELYANIVKKCLQADITGISVNQVGEVLESLRL